MKLHLGCGQKYLEGYLNIDYPQDNHTVQKNRKIDLEADILKLKYSPESIEEIRLHHVFEHFDRTTSLALLNNWSKWLCKDGIIRIEVPDFTMTALSVLSPFTSKNRKKIGLRHIFGSQEAFWAVHYNGWTKSDLIEALSLMGFGKFKIRRNQWKGTFNLEIMGKKIRNSDKNNGKVRNYLAQYMVDNSISEKSMLKVWMNNYEKALN